jgi:hypothetical protein
MSVTQVLQDAEALLPGRAAPEGEVDPRWQAMIALGEYAESDPEPLWEFVARWGSAEDEDLRSGVATCILEHLLQYHFSVIFPRVEAKVQADPRFADCFVSCWAFGQTEEPENLRRFETLKAAVRAA